MEPEAHHTQGPRRIGPDQRAELLLGALACAVLVFVGLFILFVVREAWPSFAANGLSWFSSGGSVDKQIQAIFTSGQQLAKPVYTFHAWPMIWGTLLVPGG